jgi:putative transposase
LKIKIRTLNLGKLQRLLDMQSEFTDCVRFHCERISILGTTNATEVHRDCYHEARERFRLPASTLQQARDKAIAATRSFLQRKKKDRRANPPMFRKPLPLRLAVENLKVVPDEGMIRVSTPDGFLWLPILIPACFAAALRLQHVVSEIVRQGKDWFLMLAVKTEDVPSPQGERPHFGVDLGLANLAVLSGPNLVKFFDGKPLRYVRGRYFRSRQALQKKRKTGMVKRSKGKESRWAACRNHDISRQIIDIVARAGGVLHVERLKGIRDRCQGTVKVRRMLHSWPFGQLLEFLKYKAALAGVEVVEEDPRHTSQRCSRCGHTARGNRPRQDLFRCQRCGFEIHADLNAARNLAARGACSPGVGGVTPPGRPVVESGEAMVARQGRHRGNRDLASSS